MTESGRQITSNVLENKYASGSEIKEKTEGNRKYEAKGQGTFWADACYDKEDLYW